MRVAVRRGAGFGNAYGGAAPGNAFAPGTAPPVTYRSYCSYYSYRSYCSDCPWASRQALTLIAAQAAFTAAYSALPVPPYRAEAADRVAVRAPL